VSRTKEIALLGIGAGAACLFLAACSGVGDNEREPLPKANAATFPPVALMLVPTCGTLDCHGTVGRNLRILGKEGLRLSASDVTGGASTTTKEIEADFASVIGLEPEILAAVLKDSGKNPERLTLIRKARGIENHKGGAVLIKGDNADSCLTDWLKDAPLTVSACTNAIVFPPDFPIK
jgi:hypothetical protein